MTANCVACGAETGEDAVRCPSCGLAFAPAREGSFVPAAAPAHVGLYLGAVSATVAADDDAPAAESVAPRPTAAPAGRRPWRIAGVVIAVAVAVGAVTALYLATRRPDDSWTRLEIEYQRYAYSDAISGVVEPPRLDLTAALPEVARANPQAWAAARAAYRPLPPPVGPSLHTFGEDFVARLVELSPEWSLELGVRASSGAISTEDETAVPAVSLLFADAWRVVNAWRAREDLTPHDRADGDALLGWLDDRLRASPDRRTRALWWIRGAFAVLPRLEVDESAPASERAARAAAHLHSTVPRLRAVVESLESARPAAVLDAAAALEAAERHLRAYPGSWNGLSDEQSAELGAAAAAARECVRTCAARLRNVVAPRSSGRSGMGPEALASRLRTYHGLAITPREAYDRALDELRTAHDDLRAVWSEAERERVVDEGSDGECVDRLRWSMARWVVDVPDESSPRILPTPTMWAHEDAAAWYMDPGRLGAAGRAVVFVTRRDEGGDSPQERGPTMPRRHLLAHETYPGHRLQALFDRSSCVVRRLVDDRTSREGWACYAQDLIHETGDCRRGPRDDRARAAERRGVALRALNAILVATGAAEDDAVLGLLAESGYESPTLDQVGAIAAWGDYPLCYLLGADEVRALRREEEERLGAEFDLRAFHTRLLREGPIPVPLIRRQWREERER